MKKARVASSFCFLVFLLALCVNGSLFGRESGQEYILNIINADGFESLEGGRYLLKGNVHLMIEEEGSEEKIRLYSDRLLVDVSDKSLTAMGSVRTEGAKEISGEIITLMYERGDIFASCADLVTISEELGDQPVTLHTLGTRITIQSASSMITYTDARIGTRAIDPLSSIRAKRISVLNDGDIIAHGATLSIGRVPLFWTPFLFIPGSRMIANPAMGFISNRGMFVNTTWEIFGRYPHFRKDEQRSLATLLSAKEEAGAIRAWPIYTLEKAPSSFEQWARESSSYLAIFGDAYEDTGVSLGYDSRIKLLKNTLTINSLSTVALDPSGIDQRVAWSDVNKVRMWSMNTLFYRVGSSSLTATLPYYSDPSVERLYSSRLHNLRLDALFGSVQEFPSLGSERSSYTTGLTGNLTIPTTIFKEYLSSLTIDNIALQGTYRWQKKDGIHAYHLTEVTLPRFIIRASGTLLNLAGQTTVKSPPVSNTPDVNPLLPNLYRPQRQQPASLFSRQAERSLKLSYTISEEFARTYNKTAGDDPNVYSMTRGTMILSAVPDSRFFTSSFELLPQLSVSDDPQKTTNHTQVFQLHANTTLHLPFIGVSYTLRQRLYRQEETQSGDKPKNVVIDRFRFDEKSVSTHQLRFDRTYRLWAGTINPSITAVLWPLTRTLAPKVIVRYQGASLTTSLRFKDASGTGFLEKELFSLGVGYSDSPLVTNTTFSYNYLKPLEPSRLDHQLTLSLFDKELVLSERFEYFPMKNGVEHVLSHGVLGLKTSFLTLNYHAGGTLGNIQSERLTAMVSLAERQWRFYKKRIALTLGVNAAFDYDVDDPFSSVFTFSLKSRFQIAEFLDLSIALASSNTGFHHYQDDAGSFAWLLLWKDLLRSFDLFGGGIHHTQFNLSSVDIQLIHYLEDWRLNCKYSGSVVLSNNQYRWVPTFSIYLAWNTIPDLDIEEKWSRTGGVWDRSL